MSSSPHSKPVFTEISGQPACQTCHGPVHALMSRDNPASSIHPARLAGPGLDHPQGEPGEDLRQLPPGAGTRFALGPVHVLNTAREHTGVYWIRRIYLWIIWLTIGGMVLHNALDLRRKVLSPIQRPIIPRERREAVLATLAILVWHFYSVLFDPLVYPMDTAWLHGREAPGRTLERTAPEDPEAPVVKPE